MVQSVLSNVTLGYRPVWSRARKLIAVQLFVHTAPSASVECGHLLRTVQELWHASSPTVILTAQTRQLLCNFLEHAPKGAPWLTIESDWLQDSGIFELARQAQQRKLKLIWRGNLHELPEAETAQYFHNSLLTVSPQDTALIVQAQASQSRAAPPLPHPLIAGQIYENITHYPLLEQCLDRDQALAIINWPSLDLLHSLRFTPQQPAHSVILKLLKAIEGEQSLETFEDILCEDPLLAYRFLVYTNSASLGLRTGIDSLRRGLMMMGFTPIKKWLSDQLPIACKNPNLLPVRQSMLMRAQLTAQLLNAGAEKELHREVYLCGLFSQLNLLLNEPLSTCLRRIPLSSRIYDAIVLHTGPYAGALQMACALESADHNAIHTLCETHEMELEEVNRNFLRVLSDWEVERPRK